MRKGTPLPRGNQRSSTPRQRKHQHLLNVKVRARKAVEQRTRRLGNLVCVLILLTAAGGGIYYGGRMAIQRWIIDNSDFHVNEVQVITTGTLTREETLETAQIHEGMSMFQLNLAAVRERLARIPQVESVEIERLFPDKAVIRLTERKPVAWLAPVGTEDPSTAPGALLVDRLGVVMKIANPPSEFLRLPMITGIDLAKLNLGEPADDPELPSALDLIRLTEGSTAFQVSAIDLSSGYGMVVMGRDRSIVTFGLDRLDQQLGRLSLLLEEVERSHREIRTVNLLVERNVPVTFMDDDPAAPVSAGPPPAEVTEAMPESAIEMKVIARVLAKPSPTATPKLVAPKPVAKPSAATVTKPFLSGNKAPTPAGPKPITKRFQAEPTPKKNATR